MSMDAAVVAEWADQFGSLCDRLAECFGRRDLRRRARGYLRGLLGRMGRKNMWQLAEYLGDETPHGLQRLLDRAVWNADAVRDVLVGYARSRPVRRPSPDLGAGRRSLRIGQ